VVAIIRRVSRCGKVFWSTVRACLASFSRSRLASLRNERRINILCFLGTRKIGFYPRKLHYDKVFDVLGTSAELTSQSRMSSRASERDLHGRIGRAVTTLTGRKYWRFAKQDIDGPGPLAFALEKEGPPCRSTR
jgi:hypothetical protein